MTRVGASEGEWQQQVAKAIVAASAGREGLPVTELEIANRLAPEDSRPPWWMWPTLRDMEELRMVQRIEAGGAVQYLLTGIGRWLLFSPVVAADFAGARRAFDAAYPELREA